MRRRGPLRLAGVAIAGEQPACKIPWCCRVVQLGAISLQLPAGSSLPRSLARCRIRKRLPLSGRQRIRATRTRIATATGHRRSNCVRAARSRSRPTSSGGRSRGRDRRQPECAACHAARMRLWRAGRRSAAIRRLSDRLRAARGLAMLRRFSPWQSDTSAAPTAFAANGQKASLQPPLEATHHCWLSIRLSP